VSFRQGGGLACRSGSDVLRVCCRVLRVLRLLVCRTRRVCVVYALAWQYSGSAFWDGAAACGAFVRIEIGI